MTDEDTPFEDSTGQKDRHRPLRYLIAAGLNTAFGLAIYPVLIWSSRYLADHYMVALLIAQASSLLFAFTTYRAGVFRSSNAKVGRQFGLFSSFYLFNYAANWAALPFLVEVVGISPIVAQLGASLVLMVGSYFWHSRVTFREPEIVS